MRYNQLFKMPNELITNEKNLHPSTIGVALILYAYMNKHRKFTNSLKNIATMAHRCQDTVRQAVAELESAGYIKKFQNYIYSRESEQNIYAQSTYHIIHPVQEDYTLVPYSWLDHALTPCTMQVLLSCRMFMVKEKSRSFPSIRKIAASIQVAKSTVCDAIKTVAQMCILVVESCKKEDGAYSCNSYHMLKRIHDQAVELLGRKIQPSLVTGENMQLIWSTAAPFLLEYTLT